MNKRQKTSRESPSKSLRRNEAGEKLYVRNQLMVGDTNPFYNPDRGPGNATINNPFMADMMTQSYQSLGVGLPGIKDNIRAHSQRAKDVYGSKKKIRKLATTKDQLRIAF